MRFPKLLTALLGGAFIAVFCASGSLWLDRSPLLIESEESKTKEDGPVYNKIRWLSDGKRDIWMMNQSHHGPAADDGKWDRLAIVVDRGGPVASARFYQFEPGPLEWSGERREVEYRVTCMMCHSNGPRAIRPNESAVARLGLWGMAKVFAWNLRIKTYGRIRTEEGPLIRDGHETGRQVPLRLRGRFANEPLRVKTCVHCHREEGLFARGNLTRQQILTIRSMVEKGHMPPLGFALSRDEQRELDRFLQGL